MNTEIIENIIFDMDGVLVDSEPVIEAAAIKGLQEYGVEAEPEDFIPFIGAGEDRYIGGVAEKYGVTYKTEMKDRVYEIYLEIVSDKLNVFSGTKKVLQQLSEKGFTLALASSADSIKIKANLKVAGIESSLFKIVVSGEDVQEKKPAPDIYLKTAQMLNVEPVNCLVVEDSVHGVKAAKAAGMQCAAITTSFSIQELKEAKADFIGEDIKHVYNVLV